MKHFLFVLFAISILLMTFVFIAPKPTLASEETPPPPADYIPIGCVCLDGPYMYRCCYDVRYYGGFYCVGGWHTVFWSIPPGCNYWEHWPQ